MRKADIRCMEDADDLAKKEEKRKRAVQRRKRKYEELLGHGVEAAPWEEEEEEDVGGEDAGETRRGAGESRREISWIWTAAGMSGTDADLENGKEHLFREALMLMWNLQRYILSGPSRTRGHGDGVKKSDS